MTQPMLRDALGVSERRGSDEISPFEKVEEHVRRQVRTIKWVGKVPDLTQKVAELFGIPIPDVLISAWNQAGTLRKYRDRSKYGPDEVVYVALVDHTVEMNCEPTLKIRIGETVEKKIVFTLAASLHLNGCEVKVKDGKILAVKAGTCQVKLSMKVAGADLLDKDFDPVSLPGSYDLPEPIEIAA